MLGRRAAAAAESIYSTSLVLVDTVSVRKAPLLFSATLTRDGRTLTRHHATLVH